MRCDPFESIEPYRLTAVTAATTSVHLGSLRVSLICSIWQQTSSRHVVRQRVCGHKWMLSVSQQLSSGWETDREREVDLNRQRYNKKGWWDIGGRDSAGFFFHNKCVIYKFITCYQWQNERKAAAVEGLKLKTTSKAPWASSVACSASARGFIWLVSTTQALAVLRPVWLRSSFSSVFRSGPNLDRSRLRLPRFRTWRDAGQKLPKSSSLED